MGSSVDSDLVGSTMILDAIFVHQYLLWHWGVTVAGLMDSWSDRKHVAAESIYGRQYTE